VKRLPRRTESWHSCERQSDSEEGLQPMAKQLGLTLHCLTGHTPLGADNQSDQCKPLCRHDCVDAQRTVSLRCSREGAETSRGACIANGRGSAGKTIAGTNIAAFRATRSSSVSSQEWQKAKTLPALLEPPTRAKYLAHPTFLDSTASIYWVVMKSKPSASSCYCY
jgi:hypothetical protein